MNRKSGSVLTLVMTCLLAGTAGHAMAAETGDYGVFDVIAGENGTTYENFFDVTLAEENYDLWYNCSAAVGGAGSAEDTVAFMQGYISSDRIGEEAQLLLAAC